VKIFNDHELELLISGLPEIDIEDLKANTEYAGYSAASKPIQWFWQVVRELNKQDLALLVQFVTGTSKVPLEGFSALQVGLFIALFCSLQCQSGGSSSKRVAEFPFLLTERKSLRRARRARRSFKSTGRTEPRTGCPAPTPASTSWT